MPGYTVLQEIVSQAVNFEQQRLTAILQISLTPTETAALERLLTDDSNGSYVITQLKREPADFSQKAMRQEADRAMVLRPLATLATRVLPRLRLSRPKVSPTTPPRRLLLSLSPPAARLLGLLSVSALLCAPPLSTMPTIIC